MTLPRRRRTRTLVRAVAYALILLVVITMVLSLATTALAAPGPAAASPTHHSESAAQADAAKPAPVIVLGTANLTWADLVALAQEPDYAQDASEVLAFARANEPVNLVTRTVGDATPMRDGWLTLGAGTRMSWRYDRGRAQWQPTPANRVPGALATTLQQQGLSVQAVGGFARHATSTETRWVPGMHGSVPASDGTELAGPASETAEETAGEAVGEAVGEAARSSSADLTLVDTAYAGEPGGSVRSEPSDDVAQPAQPSDASQPDQPSSAARLAALAAALRGALSRGDARIVLLSLADDADPGPQLAILPAGTTSGHGTSRGLIVGDATHRAGLIQIADLTPTLIEALTGAAPTGFDGHPLTLPATPTHTDPASTNPSDDVATNPDPTDRTSRSAPLSDPRIARLLDDAHHARASQVVVIPISTFLMAATLVLLAAAAWLLRAPRTNPAHTAHNNRRLSWLRGLALALAALPAGALLSNLLPWWRLTAAAGQPSRLLTPAAALATLAMAALTLGLLLAVNAAARRLRPGLLPPTGVVVGCGLAGATSLGWLLDGATGAHLSFNGVLGMNAVVAGRFYGMSNSAFALAASALLVLIAALWALAGRGVRAALSTVVGLGATTLILDGAPQLGADVGGALTLTPALVALGAALSGWRLGWRRWLVVGLASCTAVAGFAALDLVRPAGRRTHLGHFAAQLRDGSALSTVGRKAYALVAPFIDKPLAALTLLLALALFTTAVLLIRKELRLWRGGVSAYAWLAQEIQMPPAWLVPVLKSLGVLTLVAVLLNDSGVTMAGFVLAGAAPLILALALQPDPRPVSPAR